MQHQCKLCNKIVKSYCGLMHHIKYKHDLTSKVYYDKYNKKYNDGVCLNCKRITNFNGKQYNKYCSIICRNTDKNMIIQQKETKVKNYLKYPNKFKEELNKRRQTNIDRYGVSSYSKTKEYKEAYKSTCNMKYGVDNPSQLNVIKEKKKKTCLKNYGVDSPLKSKKIINKIRIDCLNKYGVDSHIKRPDIQEKLRQTNIKKYGVKSTLSLSTIKYKIKSSLLKKYGVDHPFKSNEIQEKIKQTNIKKYGVIHPSKNNIIKEKTKQTCMNRYGVEYSTQSIQMKNKTKQTCMNRYGVEYSQKSPQVINKIKQSCLKKYGVSHPMQNKEIHEQQQKSAYRTKPYTLPSGKIVNKQGYEPQFLDYVFKNNILKEAEINSSPNGIQYLRSDNTQHYYFPDFYIPKWNLIIEIKSIWTERNDKNVYLKESATKTNGFNYIRIKNYPNNKNLDFTGFVVFIENATKKETVATNLILEQLGE